MIEIPEYTQPEFKKVITQLCGINKLPAIFVGFKYLGGYEEV